MVIGFSISSLHNARDMPFYPTHSLAINTKSKICLPPTDVFGEAVISLPMTLFNLFANISGQNFMYISNQSDGPKVPYIVSI